MTDNTETKDVKKDVEPKEDVMSLLVKATVQNSDLLKDIKVALTKLGDSNPVAHGGVLEAKPKATDEQEIGDKVKATNNYGQSRQASIINSENPQSDTDKDDLSMEEHKKSAKVMRKEPDPDPDPEPDPEPEPETKEETKKSGVKKEIAKALNGFQYVEVTPIRPQIFAKTTVGPIANGYQIQKAIESGWGKGITDAEQSYQEAILHLTKGEYGMGVPGESEVAY